MQPEPKIADFIQHFARGVHGTKDNRADIREGAIYQVPDGVSAVIWSRQAQRDTDLFRATRFGEADGDDLTRLVRQRFGIERMLDSFGTGQATLKRPGTGAGGGTVWEGTRIRLVTSDGNTDSRAYAVSQDTVISATAKSAVVPVRATEPGTGWSVSVGYPGAYLDDPLWDSTWTVQQLSCGDGTIFEEAKAFRARVIQSRIDSRVGYRKAIIQACIAAGAQNIALFASDYAGDQFDSGLNVCYVGDAGYQTSESLRRSCMFALEKFRVLGDALRVSPMQSSALDAELNVYLVDAPANHNQFALIGLIQDAVTQKFGGNQGSFGFSLDMISGSIFRASPAVQEVDFITPTSDEDVVFPIGDQLNFPAVLTRYFPRNINVHLLPPR